MWAVLTQLAKERASKKERETVVGISIGNGDLVIESCKMYIHLKTNKTERGIEGEKKGEREIKRDKDVLRESIKYIFVSLISYSTSI